MTAILAGCGYWVGWTHGHDVGGAQAAPVVETVVTPFPYASVCTDMLEAAWSIPSVDGSPHNP